MQLRDNRHHVMAPCTHQHNQDLCEMYMQSWNRPWLHEQCSGMLCRQCDCTV
jgi:hypothetical protein